MLTAPVLSGIKQIADMNTPCIGKMHIFSWKGKEMNAHSPLAVAAMQWSKLGHIDGIRPLDASDTACLTEIRDVLRKYGNLDRFGVALLHTHFPLSDDEAMLEVTDEDARIQTLRPVKRTELTGNEIGTVWHLTEGSAETMSWCRSFCRKLGTWGHKSAHQRVK